MRKPHRMASYLVVSALAFAIGCSPPDKPTTTNSDKAGIAPTAPISPAELRRKVLTFVATLHEPGDTAYPKVEAALGIKLGPPKTPSYPSRGVSNLALTNGFLYHLEVLPPKKGFTTTKIGLYTAAGEEVSTDGTTECLLGADEFSRALEQMGYQKSAELPYRGARRWNHGRLLEKNDQQVFVVDLKVRSFDDADGSTKRCVTEVHISGGNR